MKCRFLNILRQWQGDVVVEVIVLWKVIFQQENMVLQKGTVFCGFPRLWRTRMLSSDMVATLDHQPAEFLSPWYLADRS